MDKDKIKIRYTGGKPRLEITDKGKRFSVPLDLKKKTVVKKRPHMGKLKTDKLRQERYNRPETRTGMTAPGDATLLSVKTRISFLRAEDTGSRRWFSLPMGVNGQEKMLIVTFVGVAPTLPKIKITTQQGDEVYTAGKNGQVLHLICDGTCWYPVTPIDTADANGPGKWDVD